MMIRGRTALAFIAGFTITLQAAQADTLLKCSSAYPERLQISERISNGRASSSKAIVDGVEYDDAEIHYSDRREITWFSKGFSKVTHFSASVAATYLPKGGNQESQVVHSWVICEEITNSKPRGN